MFLRKVEAGGADRSYGIEVAKLAGLPNEVIERAREVLAEHESAEQRVTEQLASDESRPRPAGATHDLHAAVATGSRKIARGGFESPNPPRSAEFVGGIKKADRLKRTTSISAEIGQLLIVGFDGAEMSPRLRSLLTRLQPAGVILFARNIASGEQTHRLLNECQSCVSTRLFTCVDMEGGRVDRFRNVIGPAPSAADVFATGNRRLYRKHGKIIGESCRALGFNTDFAPVVDLAFAASRNVMSSRSVSADPKDTIAYAREFLAGLRSAGVLGTIKHFPGLGEANLDTHHELPNVEKSWKKLWDADIAPYRALRRESPLILVGHGAYPAVTRNRTPASLSKKWITDILRKKIGYRGLIVSDDLEWVAC